MEFFSDIYRCQRFAENISLLLYCIASLLQYHYNSNKYQRFLSTILRMKNLSIEIQLVRSFKASSLFYRLIRLTR
jgi:hypothetical protein